MSVLGTGRQEAEGQVGKARSLDSVIRITDVIHAQSNSCETGPRPRRRETGRESEISRPDHL